MKYHGIAGSDGVAIAKAYVYHDQIPVVARTPLNAGEISSELDKLAKALSLTSQQIIQIRDKASQIVSKEETQIFEAHLMILDDPSFVDEIRQLIKNENIPAGYAVQKVVGHFVAMFSEIQDEYMKERGADIRDVGNRLLRNVLGLPPKGFGNIDNEVIIIANDLTPSDTIALDPRFVKGFAVNVGSRTSHAAIMARTLEIPAVLGLGNITQTVKEGDYIILDGVSGDVITEPSQKQLEVYQDKRENFYYKQRQLKELISFPAITSDGRQVHITGNIGRTSDADAVLSNGGDGIGLYRTEFLYMENENLPNEEQQFAAYKTVAQKFKDKPVIIRTLDIGGDKKISSFPVPQEANPFLGWRAIRISLARPDIFKTQLRAVLRASAYGNIRIMYPMISGVQEVRAANQILNEAKQELRMEGIRFNEQINVGIMVEIPSAALTADIISKEVDFFSIGTNDLCQYTLAVDRMNERVGNLYQPLHPGVLRLIKNVIDISHRHGKITGMCGEMAGDPAAALVLLGLGLDEFSMSAGSMLAIKKLIRNVTYKQAQELADKVMAMETPCGITQYCTDMLQKINR